MNSLFLSDPVADPPEVQDEILTLEELAARLKLSVWTVRRLVKRRIIIPLRTGRTLRFHWPSVKQRLGVTPTCGTSEPVTRRL